MDNHGKKKFWVGVITAIMLIYFLIYFVLLVALLPGLLLKAIFGIIPLLLGGVMIHVCNERMREIDGGEEDDLSKY